jgi:hypothetical protein
MALGKDDDERDRSDGKVADSRAGKSDDEDGTYVGRTFDDDAMDVGETGAEARSEQHRGQAES